MSSSNKPKKLEEYSCEDLLSFIDKDKFPELYAGIEGKFFFVTKC
jgi:hypothetical protein